MRGSSQNAVRGYRHCGVVVFFFLFGGVLVSLARVAEGGPNQRGFN